MSTNFLNPIHQSDAVRFSNVPRIVRRPKTESHVPRDGGLSRARGDVESLVMKGVLGIVFLALAPLILFLITYYFDLQFFINPIITN